jgi:hypothetical protein
MAVAILTGCSSAPPSTAAPPASGGAASNLPATSSLGSTEPGSSAPEAATPPATAYPAGDPRNLGDDLFTAAADPLTLDVTPETSTSVTDDIGPDGGTISATASDGSTFTLTIPKNALPWVTPVSVTPIAQVAGFPADAPPDRSIGVTLGPDGLQLAEPAMLTIKPDGGLPDKDVYALSFKGAGEEAGFHFYERDQGAASLTVDHFSGYEVSFPLFIADVRPTDIKKYMTQTEVEERLASEVGFYATLLRQRQEFGLETSWNLQDLARSVLPIFNRLVIRARVAVADRSCGDAQAAIQAYLMYQQQRQLLGVAEDPSFDLVGAGLFVPVALVDLSVRVCFKEAYERCKKTGEFPAMGTYFLSFLRRVELMGVEPDPEHISLAQQYLTGCGRWRVKLATTIDDPDVGVSPYHNEATREFFVQWHPSDGLYGIIGSRITGSGEVTQTQITHTGSCAPVTITDIHSGVDASAEITKLSFDHYQGPTLTGEPIPPVPSALTLDVNLGLGIHSYWCNKPNGAEYDDSEEEFGALYVILAQDQGTPLALEDLNAIDVGEFHTQIKKGWKYDLNPYRAVNVIEGRWEIGSGPGGHAYQDGRLEVIVEHSPV